MKIGVLVSDEEMGVLAVSIGQQMGVDIHWEILGMGGRTITQEARGMIAQHQVSAIIARNPHGYALERMLDVPVSIMHISRMDILRAARRITTGKTIAFLYVPEDRDKYDFNLGELEDDPAHPIRVVAIRKSTQVYKRIERQLIEDCVGENAAEFFRCDALISATPRLLEMGQALGWETSAIQFDAYEMRSAIYQAIRMIRMRDQEKRNTTLMETALNTTDTGFLILENSRVILVNENICKIANMDRMNILGKDALELARVNSFFNRTFSVNKREIINIEGRPYSVFRRELKDTLRGVDNTLMEIISIIDVPMMQKTEIAIRKSLDAKGFTAKWHFESIIAQSEKMRETIRISRQYANSALAVLITGESGTGKEVFAQSIHNASPFVKGPFVALNCAALPENLIESELFGYEEGAFTGAKKGGKMGLIEMSHGGTLFLDEIGELPMLMQAKLLRSLQEKCIYRVGGDRVIPINNRLVCATNQDLDELVRERRFREDLLYRINVLQIKLPPLRERKEDIPLFIRDFFNKNLRQTVDDKTQSALSNALIEYNWPGNVRELENYMSRLLVMRRGGTSLNEIGVYIKDTLRHNNAAEPAAEDKPNTESGEICLRFSTMKQMEEDILKAAYKQCGHNIQQVAKKLDLGYSTVWRKLKNIGNGM